jgi:hypothetical protein
VSRRSLRHYFSIDVIAKQNCPRATATETPRQKERVPASPPRRIMYTGTSDVSAASRPSSDVSLAPHPPTTPSVPRSRRVGGSLKIPLKKASVYARVHAFRPRQFPWGCSPRGW